ncbi:hypothetical protein BDN67DRAFT_964961 [Paxillus ammoniavirescens]|nr:hypothetical protein BDN67DRAFT_964961 [Paxillus ammoniavirescens]
MSTTPWHASELSGKYGRFVGSRGSVWVTACTLVDASCNVRVWGWDSCGERGGCYDKVGTDRRGCSIGVCRDREKQQSALYPEGWTGHYNSQRIPTCFALFWRSSAVCLEELLVVAAGVRGGILPHRGQ